jgi:hypothetical protein
VKNPYSHDFPRCFHDCLACVYSAGAKAGVELAKNNVIVLQCGWNEYEGLDWSDVDFELERKV